MRNLAQYPLTLEECHKSLKEMSNEIINREVVGDCRPLILNIVADFLKRDPDAFDHYLESRMPK